MESDELPPVMSSVECKFIRFTFFTYFTGERIGSIMFTFRCSVHCKQLLLTAIIPRVHTGH